MAVEEILPRMVSSSSQRSRSADEAALEDPGHGVDDGAKQLKLISSNSNSNSKHRHSRRHPRNHQRRLSQDPLQLRRSLVFPSVKSQNRRWMLQPRQ